MGLVAVLILVALVIRYAPHFSNTRPNHLEPAVDLAAPTHPFSADYGEGFRQVVILNRPGEGVAEIKATCERPAFSTDAREGVLSGLDARRQTQTVFVRAGVRVPHKFADGAKPGTKRAPRQTRLDRTV